MSQKTEQKFSELDIPNPDIKPRGEEGLRLLNAMMHQTNQAEQAVNAASSLMYAEEYQAPTEQTWATGELN